MTRKLRFAVGILPVLLAVTGCALLANTPKSPEAVRDAIGPDLTGTQESEVYPALATAATLALLVYRDDLPAEARDNLTCAHLAGAARPPGQVLPTASDGSQWRRWTEPQTGYNIPKPCGVYGHGLAYEIFYRISADDREAVVALTFRGTDDWRDWLTNAFAVIGWEPPQFYEANYLMDELLDQIRRRLEPRRVRMVTIGHSLGGALAQKVGHLSEHVEAVYAFNTSPFTDIPRLRAIGGAPPRQSLKVLRVSHVNDILEKARKIYDRQHGVDASVRDINLKFGQYGRRESHSMKLLACGIASRITDDSAALGMTSASAKRVLFEAVQPNQQPLCSKQVDVVATK